MTVRELVYNSSQGFNVMLMSYSKLYNKEIWFKFNTHCINQVGNYAEYLLSCDVRDWKINSKSEIVILTGDDVVLKILNDRKE